MWRRAKAACAGGARWRSELGVALTSEWAGFSRFALFRGPKFVYGPAISGAQSGFSQFEKLFEKFVNLGRNLKRKSAIPREIQGIGARKFVAM
jgi:hypothetical protein